MTRLPTPKRQRPGTLGVGSWILGICVALQALHPVQARGQARDWPSEPQPRPLAAHAIEFPPYEIRPLANGMRVVLVPQSASPFPVVSGRIVFT